MLAVAAAQLAQRNLAAPLPEAACPVGDRAYTSNEELWHDLISDSVRAPAVIRLMDFWLSDWFPLRPGLYHTPAARSHRAMARGHLLSGPGVNSEGLQAFERLIQHRLSQKLIGRLRPESTYVYDPYGNVGNIIVDKKVIGDNNVVASEGSAAAGLGGAAATHGSAAAVQGAAAAGQSSANRGFVEQAKKSLRVKLAGLIALLATIAATALLVSGITNLGITGYVVAVISVIVGIVPLLSTQQLVGGEETGRNKMKAGSNPHIP
jgi:hypothetical protein